MADNKLPDGEIQEQRRECLCKLTKFVGAAGVAAAVWPLVSLLQVLLLDKQSDVYGKES